MDNHRRVDVDVPPPGCTKRSATASATGARIDASATSCAPVRMPHVDRAGSPERPHVVERRVVVRLADLQLGFGRILVDLREQSRRAQRVGPRIRGPGIVEIGRGLLHAGDVLVVGDGTAVGNAQLRVDLVERTRRGRARTSARVRRCGRIIAPFDDGAKVVRAPPAPPATLLTLLDRVTATFPRGRLVAGPRCARQAPPIRQRLTRVSRRDRCLCGR